MFTIAWKVSESEWEKAQHECASHSPGSDYDVSGLAFYYLLFANVVVTWNSVSLFQRRNDNGITVSILDLSDQLARVLVCLDQGGDAQFSASDDAIDISFVRDGEAVVLLAKQFETSFRVPFVEFVIECRRFISEVVESLRERTFELLSWTSLAFLLAFEAGIPPDGATHRESASS